MRNRASTVAWALIGVGFGLQGCAPEERVFGEPMSRDGGGGDREDASVTTNPEEAGAPTDVIVATDTLVVGEPDASSPPTEPQDDTTEPNGTVTTDATGGAETVTSSDVATGSAEPDPTSDPGVTCTAAVEVEANCTDHVDDDCDGLYDCEDTDDCGASLDCLVGCVPSSSNELTCNDVVDDDCDGFTDCDDVDCVQANNCKTDCDPEPEVCGDSVDNDCDGFTDCLDSSCSAGASCCVESGAEVCNDGIDNNCDGVIDCPVLVSAIPALPATDRKDWEGGAVAANQAKLVLDTPAATQYAVQCRSGKPADVSTRQFTVCNPMDPSSTEITPLREVDGSNPVFNGLVSTQVRFAYPNGQTSKPISYTYYVHNSLAGAQPCPERTTDQAFFDFAATYLASGPAPFADAEARLAAPFVNIDFTPPTNSIFEVAEGEGSVEYLSLRRRFSLSPDKHLILMKRVYGSRRSTSDCLAATIRKHQNEWGGVYDHNRDIRSGCHAIVLNKEGAGLCLNVDESQVISIVNPTSAPWQYWNVDVYGWFNWRQADNFLWRKLLRKQNDGSFETFSPKCYEGGLSCTGGNPNKLFLPDHDLFGL